MTNKYFIDGKDIYDNYGITVEKADNLLEFPKAKQGIKTSWNDESGSDYDVTESLVFEESTITLSCYIGGTSLTQIRNYITTFIKDVSTAGLHILRSVIYSEYIPVLYQGCSNLTKVTTISASEIYCQFTMTFIKPYPEYKVGTCVTTAPNEQVEISWLNGKRWIAWIGTHQEDDTTPIQYTVPDVGTYNVVLVGTGVISDTITKTSNITWL